MFPLVLALVFTAVFAATGLYALTRFAALASGASTGDRLAELSHVLMSVAMIGMAWGWSGDPGTADGVLQIVVFGLVGAWYLVRALGPDGRGPAGVYHVVMPVAMVWMVAAMPGLMGMAPGSGGHDSGGHGAHGASDDVVAGVADVAAPLPTPPWMQVVTVAFAVLLGVAAIAWAATAVRPARVPVTAGAPAPEPPRSSPRLNAASHVLMSLGMAGMLLAML